MPRMHFLGQTLLLVVTILHLSMAPLHAQTGASNASLMFRGGPDHLGSYPYAGPTSYRGIRWRFQTNGPIVSTPVARRDTVISGSSDGHVYAIDGRSGREVWRHRTGGSVNSSPAIWQSSVIFQSSDGVISSLNMRNGHLSWQIRTGAELAFPWGYESGDIYSSSPTVVEDRVVIGAGDGGVYCIDAPTGRIEWRFQTGGRVRATPAVSGGTVFVGSADGLLYAIDLDSGQQQWTYATEGSELFSGDFGYDRRTIQSSAAVWNGTVYFGARDGFLYAVETATGKLRWRFNHEISWVISSPAVAGDRIFAASSDGRFIQAVDANTGVEVWRMSTASNAWFSPVVAGDVVYFGDASGDFLAIDRETGTSLWKERFGGPLRGSAIVTSDLIVFGTGDGAVYALGTDGDAPIHRAVFWDTNLAEDAIFRGHEQVRDRFADTYDVLDADALRSFVQERIYDRARSVVVFAIDVLPEALTEGAQNSVFRQWMETGGRAIWLGAPPLLWEKDPETGNYAIDRIDRGRPTELLSVDHTPGNFDRLGVKATRVGLALGLPTWSIGPWAVNRATVSDVLAYDEFGRAASWIKTYGGPDGGAFIRLWGQRNPIPDLEFVRIVAEWRPFE